MGEGGERGIAALILHLRTGLRSEVSGQLRLSAALPPGKERQLATEQEAVWTPEPIWTVCIKDKSVAPAGNPVQHVSQSQYRPEAKHDATSKS